MKLDHIVVLVSNLAESIAFYETLLPLLGFRKTADYVYGNGDDVYFDIRQAENLDHPYERYAPGLNHIGLSATSRDEITHIQAKMSEAGYQAPDIQTFGKDIAIFLKDPDGMRIEVAVSAAT